MNAHEIKIKKISSNTWECLIFDKDHNLLRRVEGSFLTVAGYIGEFI